MNKFYSYLAAGCMAVISLTSCSRSDYAFKAGAGSYHTASTPVAAEARPASMDQHAASTIELTASTNAEPTLLARPEQEAARELTSQTAANTKRSAAAAKTTVQGTKAERKTAKALVKQLSKERAVAPASKPAEEGKSQVVALILALLIGSLGIHRFYLGYTGIGIAQLLTLGGCGIWTLIDIIRILTDDLKPKGADYTKKL